MKYVIALDQGTTSSRAVVWSERAEIVAVHAIEFPQIYPKPGWVEHNPNDILYTQTEALRQVVEKSGIDVADISAIGITNQRETTVIWDRETGRPLMNAVVWQCRRTAPLVESLKRQGLEDEIRERTGLIPDAYFSGTKLRWMLDATGAQERAENGEICFGTIDTFLIWNLTREHVFVTDATNASRTMLYSITSGDWDEELLKMLSIPRQMLPRVTDSSGVVGMLDPGILGREIPIAGIAGDQHAALFGQACFESGMCKNTYGTGCFLLMNTGLEPVRSRRLLTTVAWQIDGVRKYALEGSVFVGGAVVQWLRDELRLIDSAKETEAIAQSVPDSAGVYLVPAFTGLGAPYWDMYARGTMVGLTRGAGRAHIVRAALEAIAYQSADLMRAMASDSGISPALLRVDGGASANNFLMQFQSDISGVRVLRPRSVETTAMGAAMLAGRATGVWTDSELNDLQSPDRVFEPDMADETRRGMIHGWDRAVERARAWTEE